MMEDLKKKMLLGGVIGGVLGGTLSMIRERVMSSGALGPDGLPDGAVALSKVLTRSVSLDPYLRQFSATSMTLPELNKLLTKSMRLRGLFDANETALVVLRPSTRAILLAKIVEADGSKKASVISRGSYDTIGHLLHQEIESQDRARSKKSLSSLRLRGVKEDPDAFAKKSLWLSKDMSEMKDDIGSFGR